MDASPSPVVLLPRVVNESMLVRVPTSSLLNQEVVLVRSLTAPDRRGR